MGDQMTKERRLDGFDLAVYYLGILWFTSVFSEGVTSILVHTNYALNTVDLSWNRVFIFIWLHFLLFEHFAKPFNVNSLYKL